MLLTNSWTFDCFIIIATIIFGIYKYFTRHFDYWEKRGIPFEKPTPFLGSLGDVFFMRNTIGLWLKRLYDSVPGSDYFGIFVFDQPRLVLRSKNLVKQVLITDFQYFNDRTFAAPLHNEIERNWLFSIKNPDWKMVRSKTTPMFSSGRLKKMFHLMLSISEDLSNYIDQHIGNVELKGPSSMYSVSVIAQCAFGIKPKCFEDNCEFYNMALRIWNFNFRNGFVQMLYFFRQRWVDYFRVNFLENFVENYLYNIFMSTMEMRKGNLGTANDLIDIINEMRKSETFKRDAQFEGPKVASQAIQFFQAGFETTSTTISFAIYELCIHPEIQTRLREEVLEKIEKHGGITWDAIADMTYLEMCLAESLRKYPVLPFLDRECNTDYTIPGTNFVIEKGMNVYIPLFGLHYDEEYFPDPYKFDPERFAHGKLNTNGSFYIPFGDGPRNCIGERFGRLASKVALCQLISRYEFLKNDKTPVPVEFSPKSFLLASKVGLPVTVRKYVPK